LQTTYNYTHLIIILITIVVELKDIYIFKKMASITTSNISGRAALLAKMAQAEKNKRIGKINKRRNN
jgi:hypothetical protein